MALLRRDSRIGETKEDTEGGREGGREGERRGGREAGRERQGGREAGREGGREGGGERERQEGGRERVFLISLSLSDYRSCFRKTKY